VPFLHCVCLPKSDVHHQQILATDVHAPGQNSLLCVDSCFLLAMQQDSIEGIYDTLKQCALISKSAGGVGLHVHCIRASGSFIAGVSRNSNSFIIFLAMFVNNVTVCTSFGWFVDHVLF